MIEIVIKIPKDVYTRLFDNGIQDNEIAVDDVCEMARALRLGTPLPEHHGRLIDADKLTRAEIMHLWYHLPNGDIACPKVDIDHAPTIIEGSDSE